MYAFYDLAVSPPSYDVVAFLIKAEMARRRSGAPYTHIVVVPGPHGGFRTDKSGERNELGQENMRWRLRDVVVSLCWLLPSCQAVTVCANRQEAVGLWQRAKGGVFPDGYSVSVPVKANLVKEITRAARGGADIPSLKAAPAGRYHVGRWLKERARGRRTVTVTLRESSYGTARNSDLKQWGEFARGLDAKRYFPVIVRDFERVFDQVPAALRGLAVFQGAVWNAELRLALYELSCLNLFVSNGPQVLGWFDSKVNFLGFKVITKSCPSTTEEFFYWYAGLRRGENFPWFTAGQRLVWEEDKAAVIKREFDKMDRQLTMK